MSRRNVGKPWFNVQEELLKNLIRQKIPIEDICDELGRNIGGITARIDILMDQHKISSEEVDYLRHQIHFPSIDFRRSIMNTDYDYCTPLNVKAEIGETTMSKTNNTWTMVSMLQEDIITVKVQFSNRSHNYTYKTRDKSIKVNDYVVVNPGAEEGNFSVGQVVAIDDFPDFEPEAGLRYHWIVCKIDTTVYDSLVVTDEKAYELLINAEKHVARKKLMDMYKEVLNLPNIDELSLLLNGKLDIKNED